MVDSYAKLIGESLASIATEAPGCYAAASSAASNLTLTITIDGEAVGLVADPLLRVVAPASASAVRAATTSGAITAILDGNSTIETLVLNDHLQVQGTIDNIARGHDVLVSYVHGAVRSPSVPRLRHRFDVRAGAAQ